MKWGGGGGGGFLYTCAYKKNKTKTRKQQSKIQVHCDHVLQKNSAPSYSVKSPQCY